MVLLSSYVIVHNNVANDKLVLVSLIIRSASNRFLSPSWLALPSVSASFRTLLSFHAPLPPTHTLVSSCLARGSTPG